ncbi:MAG: helix-turn-helix domain-containing protein [Pseudomonadota bacterium]
MSGTNHQLPTARAINSSWHRCEHVYNLKRDAGHPILRLQSSEIAPRLEALVTEVGGRQGIFRKLARLAAAAGHCLVVTDKDGILVRLECDGDEVDWNGIALGSVWDERVAGTSGVSMALSEGREFTVRGKEHFYAKLRHFSCTGVPLRNASNEVIGAVGLTSIDQGNPGTGLFARQLLSAAASRVQQTLFERDFSDATIVSVAVPGQRELVKDAELVAVDDAGYILSATSSAHEVSGLHARENLVGLAFDTVFGTDLPSLDRVPGRVMSVRKDRGPLLDLWVRTPLQAPRAFPGFSDRTPTGIWRGLQTSMAELAVGSGTMAEICKQAKASFENGIPLVIEGETGTGKSALVSTLIRDAHHALTVDCAALSDTADDRDYIRSVVDQCRLPVVPESGPAQSKVLVLDNADEMPAFAQAEIRKLVDDMEGNPSLECVPVKLIATGRSSLRQAVARGSFREDLYYMLAGLSVELPPLRNREALGLLAAVLARKLAGHDVDIAKPAIDAIHAHRWDGNVRELRHALQQVLLQGDGKRIDRIDVGAPMHADLARPRNLRKYGVFDEGAMILEALRATNWNVSKAARHLGMGRATIHRKMKAFQISRPT